MAYERSGKAYLKYLSEHFPALVITGARQTGKTTLIKEFAADIGGVQYVTLDYPILLKRFVHHIAPCFAPSL